MLYLITLVLLTMRVDSLSLGEQRRIDHDRQLLDFRISEYSTLSESYINLVGKLSEKINQHIPEDFVGNGATMAPDEIFYNHMTDDNVKKSREAFRKHDCLYTFSCRTHVESKMQSIDNHVEKSIADIIMLYELKKANFPFPRLYYTGVQIFGNLFYETMKQEPRSLLPFTDRFEYRNHNNDRFGQNNHDRLEKFSVNHQITGLGESPVNNDIRSFNDLTGFHVPLIDYRLR